ncbi:hypothetical protein NPIL_628731 [Nephila pilipes]|uniref:Uncharacterized protein n=1 Tax=Nephila pilipes TaxID=299642 RepID=A0A8X6UGY6_NEPPI|nr:hypothetical protein NPIL_628731 [Nephila pilipes]
MKITNSWYGHCHEGAQIATVITSQTYDIGRGGRMFGVVMNLPKPLTRIAPYNKTLLNAVKLVFEEIRIEPWKVIDIEILSKYLMSSNKRSHHRDCKSILEGSSGLMEVEGALRIFQRSMTLLKHGISLL